MIQLGTPDAWAVFGSEETPKRPSGGYRCLGTNKDGSPRHPLYLPAATERRPWSPNV